MSHRNLEITDKKNKVIFIVGPTAVGKTAVAMKLAPRINAEIISCDSMQIYKGMDIITAKPSLTLKRRIPYHLIDIVSPSKDYNVSRYAQEATQRIKDILGKRKIPLIVGGTGLYVSGLINGIFKARAEDKNMRRQFYKEAQKSGSEYLYQRLQKKDPQAAAKIHPHDTRRIVRALEVFYTTGEPISRLQKYRKGLKDKYAVKIFCLNLKRSQLYKRIEARVDKMFAAGLVNEVKRLLKLRLSKTAAAAIGIKELKGYLTGQYNLEEAKRLIKRNTRHFAKNQFTWFKKDRDIKWINIKARERPAEIANRILRKV